MANQNECEKTMETIESPSSLKQKRFSPLLNPVKETYTFYLVFMKVLDTRVSLGENLLIFVGMRI
jgi:hypothetical protein